MLSLQRTLNRAPAPAFSSFSIVPPKTCSSSQSINGKTRRHKYELWTTRKKLVRPVLKAYGKHLPNYQFLCAVSAAQSSPQVFLLFWNFWFEMIHGTKLPPAKSWKKSFSGSLFSFSLLHERKTFLQINYTLTHAFFHTSDLYPVSHFSWHRGGCRKKEKTSSPVTLGYTPVRTWQKKKLVGKSLVIAICKPSIFAKVTSTSFPSQTLWPDWPPYPP